MVAAIKDKLLLEQQTTAFLPRPSINKYLVGLTSQKRCRCNIILTIEINVYCVATASLIKMRSNIDTFKQTA